MNERVKWQRVTDSSGACVTRRRPAVHGTGRRAPQPRRAGISTVFDTRTSTDARGTGPPACQQLGEGIWSACDMHMRMDARGTRTPPACTQPREGIWSACDMHMRMDARGDVYTCASAAGGGHLECLRYAHENGCPWDVYTCRSAARGGHLECLRYAHENGCPWDGATCMQSAALREGHLECLRSAAAHDEWMPVGRGHLHVRSRGRASGVPALCTHENGCPCLESCRYL